MADAVSESTLRKFCEHSPENLDWLMQQGVPFDASACPYKTSYPSNQYYFYYSGNESFAPYSDVAKPAARGHRAHGKSVSGAALFTPLRQSALHKGVKLLQQHKAMRLIRHPNISMASPSVPLATTVVVSSWARASTPTPT